MAARVDPSDEFLNISSFLYEDFNSTLINHTFTHNFTKNGSIITTGLFGWCHNWKEFQHWLFNTAHLFFFISYALPTNRYGLICMHTFLIVGFSFLSSWAWRVACAPDIFIWNLFFISINLFQLIYVLYQSRPVKFDPDFEEVYTNLFEPFKVSRLQFKKLVNDQVIKTQTLQPGEAYAVQNITRTDRLALLLTGKAYVSIIAHTTCRIMYWQRSTLEYLFVKETYLANVMTVLVAKDITTKLYAMNNKIMTEKGSHLDIRLPCVTSAIKSKERRTSMLKAVKKNIAMEKVINSSPESVASSRERLVKKSKYTEKKSTPMTCNHTAAEMVHLRQLSADRSDDTGESSCVENWLETSSKYHSCEIVED
ncbi:hypothetical protein M8J75_012245 [Diaphorina citri]|nr:hypothetical protein M8J75_012245 [Diaphorina citri]